MTTAMLFLILSRRATRDVCSAREVSALACLKMSKTFVEEVRRVWAFTKERLYVYTNEFNRAAREDGERNAVVRARERIRRNECIFQEGCCIRLFADRKMEEEGRAPGKPF